MTKAKKNTIILFWSSLVNTFIYTGNKQHIPALTQKPVVVQRVISLL